MESHHVTWATEAGFQSATGEGWWLLLLRTEKDKEFSHSDVKIQIVKNPIYNICIIISGKNAMLSIPLPFHMQWIPGCNLLIASPFLQWSVILLHPRLTAPPLISRAELFCNICWCGSASKCCRIVLLLEFFFFADRRGEEPPNVIGCTLWSAIIIYICSTCVDRKMGGKLPLLAYIRLFNILLRSWYWHVY